MVSRRVGLLLMSRPPESQTEPPASRNIKSDLGEVLTHSGEDKICEFAAMVQRGNNTRLYFKKKKTSSCIGNCLIQQAVENRRAIMLFF